jgi:hypothetical protein
MDEDMRIQRERSEDRLWCRHLNPMPFEAACQMEKERAEDLREQGYAVREGA